MDAALAAQPEREMLDCIGDVDGVAIDARFLERLVEQRSSRANEGSPGKIFLVARLLADEHDRGVERTFAEHRLGREPVEIAAPAPAGILEQFLPGRPQIPAGLNPALGLDRQLQTFGRDVRHRPCKRVSLRPFPTPVYRNIRCKPEPAG